MHACDHVLASEHSEILEGHIGIRRVSGAGGIPRMPRRISVLRARDLVPSTCMNEAAEACSLSFAKEWVAVLYFELALSALIGTHDAEGFLSQAAIEHLINRQAQVDRKSTLEGERALKYRTGHGDAHESFLAIPKICAPRLARPLP